MYISSLLSTRMLILDKQYKTYILPRNEMFIYMLLYCIMNNLQQIFDIQYKYITIY